MESHKFVPRARVVERIPEIVRGSKDKTVLSIGMGGFIDDPSQTDKWIRRGLEQTAHARVAKVAGDLTGLDINPAAIEAMKSIVPGNYYIGDITDAAIVEELNKTFDLVLFTEVIEHLDSYRDALSNIRKLLAPHGELLITTVNAFAFERIGKMLFRYESVHDEHTAYFSYSTMKRLLAMNGFEVAEFYFYNQARYTFDSIFERLGYYAMLAISKLFPQYSEGIFVVAKPLAPCGGVELSAAVSP